MYVRVRVRERERERERAESCEESTPSESATRAHGSSHATHTLMEILL